jgi:hypothetical protein
MADHVKSFLLAAALAGMAVVLLAAPALAANPGYPLGPTPVIVRPSTVPAVPPANPLGPTSVILRPSTVPPVSTRAARAAITPRVLVLSSNALVPGQSLVLRGSGCAPGIEVPIFIDGRRVGSTTANSQGSFSAAVTPDQVGQLTITAKCGDKTFVSYATLVATVKALSPAGSSAVFGVFVLLGVVLLRGQITGGGSTRRRRRRGAADILASVDGDQGGKTP